ncbi:MAG: 6-phosphogluconolactonase [Bacteroidales bacterium]|nr:6-phosphogluconolactonase [Bacteroidales bacterium]
MSTRSIHVFPAVNDLAAFFADLLSKEMARLKTGEFFSLALSGGSTPKAVFEYLSQHKQHIPWQRLQLFWGDERCVPPEHPESNYNMVQNSLLRHISIPSGHIFRIKGEAEPQAESVRYAETIVEKIPSVNKVPRFDLVMLGMGEDGHTASLFPGNINVGGSQSLFEVATHPVSGQRRITATLELINNAKTIVFLVTGQSKAEMLSRILEKKEGWERYPASMVKANHGKVLWLTDNAAASKLKI